MKETFSQFILKEIAKSNMNRMNLTNFTRLVRKKVQDVPSSQLMYLYAQLQKLKTNRFQFHTHHYFTNDHEPFRHSNSKPMMKFESYEKHTLICLEQIAMKLKEKNGFEQGVDLCKLFYLRLLNVIEYNLPYLNVLEQFREEFLWRDVGQQVIDYVALIQKDPTPYGNLYVETVNLIIQQVSEQLDNIDILQLPYLKFVLSKGQKYQTYNITEDLLERVDKIISQNRFAFTFAELQKSLTSDNKNKQTLEYYALLNKQMTDKRLTYLYIDSCNDKLLENKGNSQFQTKKQIGLPGKAFAEEQIEIQLIKIQNLSFYGAYLEIFTNLHQENKLKTISLTKQYIKYHFKYFSHSGNLNCDLNQIIKILSSTLKNTEKPKQKQISLKHVQILRLFFVIQMLLRNQVSGKQIKKSHQCLVDELEILNKIQKPKLENVNKIFDGSIKYFSVNQDLTKVQSLIHQFGDFVTGLSENSLSKMINEELETFGVGQKTFVMNELIIYLMSTLKCQELKDFRRSVVKLLQALMKGQFKKYSVEAFNIQKIIALVKQSQNHNFSQKQHSSPAEKEKNPQQKRDADQFFCEATAKIKQDPKSIIF